MGTKQMRTADEKLHDLRKQGVTAATFFPDGALASVTFGPVPSADDDQARATPSEDQQLIPRASPTAGLIPRVQRDG
jgi:hypothetical protein